VQVSGSTLFAQTKLDANCGSTPGENKPGVPRRRSRAVARIDH
jgi:hypothetical protein